MDSVIQYINNQNVTDYIQIIKLLMEQAEKISADGGEKFNLVVNAWTTISNSPAFANVLGPVSFETVKAVIETIILATKTTIAVNKSTGCWTSFLSLFKKKPAPTAAVA